MLNEELAGTLVLDKPIQSSIPSTGTPASGDHESRLAALASGQFHKQDLKRKEIFFSRLNRLSNG